MASQLLQMRSTPPQSGELSSEQSLALVKIFVNASLACICHTRELLNWSSDCFRKRFIDDVSLDHEPDEIYKAFCSLDSPSTKPSQEVRVLVPSDSSRANGVLDMIEAGVFDAMHRSYLDLLHVFVTSTAQDDAPVLETYTYTFEYRASHVTNVRIGETGKAFSLADSQKSFKTAIRALLRTMKDLPDLPKPRALGMSMSFRADCPQSYQPAGFRSADEHRINVGDWYDLWEVPSTTVTSFEAAHHIVKIAARNKECTNQSTSQLHDALMSKHLHNMQRTSSQNAGLRSTLPFPAIPPQGKQVLNGSYAQKRSSRGQAKAASDYDVEVTADDPVKAGVVKPSPRRRKISVSGRFIQVDRSSPATGVSLDEEVEDTYASRESEETGSEDDFN